MFYANGLAEAWQHFGRFLVDGGATADGESAWEKSIALRKSIGSDPDTHGADYVHRFARSLISSPFEAQRDAALAAQVAAAIRDGHEEHAEYWSTLGAALLSQMKFEESIETLRQAKLRRIEPHARDSFLLALAYQNRGKDGDDSKAADEFQNAAKLMSELAPANVELNQLLAEAGNALGIQFE